MTVIQNDPTSTPSDLYDPVAMSAPLLKAHQELDRQRVEYLFALYEKLTAPLVAAAKPRRKGR